nr:NfeD family protein [uncultured Carboxylicivirga sp.]
MSLTVIVLIILLGLFLLVLEFFVFPGVTVAGIGGFLFAAGGIYLVYIKYGNSEGNIALLSTLAVGIVILVMAFRSKTWNRLMLNSNIEGKIETVEEENIKEGDEGVAVTRLNPIGKVMVNSELVEGRCPGHFVDENTSVIIQKVYKTYVIVKPKK